MAEQDCYGDKTKSVSPEDRSNKYLRKRGALEQSIFEIEEKEYAVLINQAPRYQLPLHYTTDLPYGERIDITRRL